MTIFVRPGLPRLPCSIHAVRSEAYLTGVAPADGTGVCLRLIPKSPISSYLLIYGRYISALILDFLAGGETCENILQAYPQLTEKDIQLCLKYAARPATEEVVYESKVA
ncbi:MAG: hypothetical protein SRB2_02741 [Desulfobacteraceae bacterium Eth-SRB2]|nr:MAG: hypothetical protein SRB2_02741 [Desulfobacteraceae bacterium Eth-SRB2]